MFRAWLRAPSLSLAPLPARPGAAAPRRRPARPALERLEDRNLLSSWTTHGHDAQHTGVSDVQSQPLWGVQWQAPVDLMPQYDGNDLLIHYGSPLVTPANTVIFPVKTGATGGFRVEGHSGADGSLLWMQPTDYRLPPHNWTPSVGPTLTPDATRLYFAGAGGTVYYIDNPDSPGATIGGQLAFFGLNNYQANPAAYNAGVYVDTPLTADAAGNIYFGFRVTQDQPLHLRGGIARIAAAGTGSWVMADTASSDPAITKAVMNCAPALSNDGSTLYVAVNTSNYGRGYLLQLNSTTLATVGRVALRDAHFPSNDASLPDDGTASPMVGPDGDVYFGVLANPGNGSRGWMLHYSGDLSVRKTPGAFGWDNTASVIDPSLVPQYQGSSTYLIMTKYNNYAGIGGDGVNKIAILDPNDTQIDSHTGATVMREVITIAGVTPDTYWINQGYPNAVREWCINAAAVDPYTGSVLANSEDGALYRWDLASNTFTESVSLTPGIGEAYTPTVVGVDGTVYAINNATLFAVGWPYGPPAPAAAHGRHAGVDPALALSLPAADRAAPFAGPLAPAAVAGAAPAGSAARFDAPVALQTGAAAASRPPARVVSAHPRPRADLGTLGDEVTARFEAVPWDTSAG
jgi:hypothetical protein